MQKYSYYEYEVLSTDIHNNEPKYDYVIYLGRNYLGQPQYIESDEWFFSAQEATNAAISHIDHLENGIG